MECFFVVGNCHEVQGYIGIPSLVPCDYGVSFQKKIGLEGHRQIMSFLILFMECFFVIAHCHEEQGYIGIPCRVPYASCFFSNK